MDYQGPLGREETEAHEDIGVTEAPLGKRVTLGPQATFLIWNVSLGTPAG